MAFAPTIDFPYTEIARYCEEHGIVELSVFGSAARGELREDSDVDLLVTFSPEAYSKIGLIEYIRIADELGEIIGRRVDLVQPEGLKSRIKDSVLKSAIPIYALN